MTPAKLRAARKRLGMTQRRLAEALGVPPNTVYRWETGRMAILHPRILELALRALATPSAETNQ